MQFFTITSIAAALVGTANAAVARHQQTSNPHIADFRLYGDEDCKQPINQGVWTVQSNDFKNDECKALDTEEYPHISILLGDILPDCSITAYESPNCIEETGTILIPNATSNCTDAHVAFVAFSVNCKNHP